MDKARASARQFLKWCRDEDEEDREQVQQWLDQSDTKEEYRTLLLQRFGSRIAFGTAGLRAAMAPGTTTINALVILQTTQGLCRYAQENINNFASKGVIIGYDSRHNSHEYAKITAAVFLSQDVKVRMFSGTTATPFVPFGVSYFKAGVGVMVTASHNPKEDNGYKVYWENGAQIIPPHDNGIADSILANLEPWTTYSFTPDHTLLSDPTQVLTTAYFDRTQRIYSHCSAENPSSKLRVAFTAMHGVGAPFVAKALAAFGLPEYVPVPEQIEPDPEFPTVRFPNPEEGKGALELAIQTANANDCTLILATDPDADRLAAAEKTNEEEWYIFNGNEMAVLLADWVWNQWRKKHPDVAPDSVVMLASTVSSKLLAAMAAKEGFQFVETLTGFKWIANVALDQIAKGKLFLFAYEVEIGFLIGDLSMDKDGIRSAAVFTEMASQLQIQGKTCVQRLQELYQRYGYFEMNASYFFCESKQLLDSIFQRIRTAGPDGGHIRFCGDYKVETIRDATTGFDDAQPDNKSALPLMPNDHMVTFRFENGCVCTIRNSGTEPKLKYYVECSDDTAEKARANLESMTKVIVDTLIQPEKNHLVGPPQS